MKKSAVAVLLALTLAFAAFVAGFYLGRNYDHSSIQISGVLKVTTPSTAPSQPQATATTVPATLDETTLQLMAAINAATLADWDAVNNIGPITAQRILDYRSQYGDFQRPEDLLNVSGIGEKTLQTIIDHFLGRLHNEDTGRG